MRSEPSTQARARGIRLAVFDVDGILTDGTLYLSDGGEEMKAFNTRDGHGLKMLQQSGVTLALLSARRSPCVENRARDLGISHTLLGVGRKQDGFAELLAKLGLEAHCASYMGDDVIDLPVLRRCGLAATVPEAPELVRSHCHHVTQSPGGRGAVREFCELVMLAQGTLYGQLSRYLE